MPVGKTRRGLGRLGAYERFEPTVRAVASRVFRVDASLLHPNASIAHDLAIDVATLTRVAVELERALDVRLPDALVDRVDTYGDLVEAFVQAWLRRDLGPGPEPFMLRTLVVPRIGARRGIVARCMPSSPYALEILADDARRAGAAACLKVTVPADAPLSAVQGLERAFADVLPPSVGLRIECDDGDGRGRAVA